ncbi:DJ-1/PfpI family protein [Massilia sp. NR 4-1]|uniref:DJ-1/PfpI family protein n=1 Tax=Massilia sp. NR 4-1 TaxID=1678028 RepID=UPI00067E1F47|nr:DJ-1/PfpI family protein [Massilia sp. NR 4-1]AKU21273.1 glutamine amidotransferase [Massilia sp. NR 4-1]
MKVYLAVLDTLADWEIAYLTAELYSKRFFRNPETDCEILKVGLTPSPIRTMGGMEIKPDLVLPELSLDENDLLVLPGSELWEDPQHGDPFLHFAGTALAEGRNVAAICGGADGLARIGALNHRPHTANNKDNLLASYPEYAGAAHYQEAPAWRDANLITASGLAPLEFAREVIGLLGVFKPETLEAWYRLFQTREPQYFGDLVASMQP